MSTHPFLHVLWTLGFLGATALAATVVRSRVIRRRLLFVLVVFLAALAVHVAVLELPGTVLLQRYGQQIENFLVAFGVITAAITLLLNPWFRDRVGGGTPAIVQDTAIAALTTIAAMFAFQSFSFLVGVTGSAIVLGLALQDTLGNAFAGLAIQVERPFRVGHWIDAGGHEGRVVEVTWRATKIRTKAGNLVVLPNSEVAKEAINNFSEPANPTRVFVEVGTSYLTPPNESRDAILTALGRVPAVLTVPAPDVLLQDFGASALLYRARFWIKDFEHDEVIRSDVRTAVYYELHRRGIEIPWPIQVEYHRHEAPTDSPRIRDGYVQAIARVPVFTSLPPDALQALAAAAGNRLFADREVIVREGEAGGSMFIVRRGRVAVTVGSDRRLVAVTETGGYFGEMSLLTGDPRTATVTARGDCEVLEIAAADFRSYVQGHPQVLEPLAVAAEERRRALDETRAATSASSPAGRQSLVRRMRTFFGLE